MRLFEYLLDELSVFERIDKWYYAYIEDYPVEFDHSVKKYCKLFEGVECVFECMHIRIVVPASLYETFNPELAIEAVCGVFAKYMDEYAYLGRVVAEGRAKKIVHAAEVFGNRIDIADRCKDGICDMSLCAITDTEWVEPCEVLFAAIAYYNASGFANMSFVIPCNSIKAYCEATYDNDDAEITEDIIKSYLDDWVMYSISMIGGKIIISGDTKNFFKLYDRK